MNNETWTDWLIQCDMLQDSSGFSACTLSLNESYCAQDRIGYLGGSRVGGRYTNQLRSWSQAKSEVTHYSKTNKKRVSRNRTSTSRLANSFCRSRFYESKVGSRNKRYGE